MDNIDSSSGATAGSVPQASIGSAVALGQNNSTTTMPVLGLGSNITTEKKKLDKKREIHLNAMSHALSLQVKQHGEMEYVDIDTTRWRNANDW